jgi:hypothetical protein
MASDNVFENETRQLHARKACAMKDQATALILPGTALVSHQAEVVSSP